MRFSRTVLALVAAGSLAAGGVALAAPADAISHGCTATATGTFAVGETVTATLSVVPTGTQYGWATGQDLDGDGVVNPVLGDPVDEVSSGGVLSHTITDADLGKQLFFIYTNGSVQCSTNLSALVGRIAVPAPRPTASGKAKVGKTLTASLGNVPGGTTVSYQWVRLGKAKHGTPTTKAIRGATGSSYKLRGADRHKSVGVTVTYTRAGNLPAVLTSKGKTVH